MPFCFANISAPKNCTYIWLCNQNLHMYLNFQERKKNYLKFRAWLARYQANIFSKVFLKTTLYFMNDFSVEYLSQISILCMKILVTFNSFFNISCVDIFIIQFLSHFLICLFFHNFTKMICMLLSFAKLSPNSMLALFSY